MVLGFSAKLSGTGLGGITTAKDGAMAPARLPLPLVPTETLTKSWSHEELSTVLHGACLG